MCWTCQSSLYGARFICIIWLGVGNSSAGCLRCRRRSRGNQQFQLVLSAGVLPVSACLSALIAVILAMQRHATLTVERFVTHTAKYRNLIMAPCEAIYRTRPERRPPTSPEVVLFGYGLGHMKTMSANVAATYPQQRTTPQAELHLAGLISW